ncbi:LuxR C-terminal-related transcriptional regulator [Streptomyces sp. NPDC053048]|uniref:LuxR C-terminal-related transcriptional regulator n=1 Tax=Streptomyces sp. NPDC053048 TaxID=3365694 RepID=UPI0037D821E0
MTPLLDRRHELDLITAALATAAGSGTGSLLVVTGGIGIGRTALLRALPGLAQRHGTRTLAASGAPLEQDLPFGLVSQLLEPLCPGTALEPPGAAPYGDLLAPVAEVSAREPLLLLVDDLHWADEPSLRRLGQLVRRLPALPVTLAVTVREGEPGAAEPRLHDITDRAAHVLRPAPLTPAGTAALVAAAFGRAADPEYATACHEATGGNPMFLTATLAALSGTGDPVAARAHTVREQRLPGLRERLAVALRSQPGPVRELAKALAVLDDGTDPDLVGRLAGLDAPGHREALAALRRLGLLAPAPGTRFVHHAVHDAVEDSMTPAEQEELHTFAALLLHRGGHRAEQAAAQLLAATSCQDDWAMDVLRAAADAARSRGAHEEAARYLRRALLGSSHSGPDRAALLVDLATVERAFDPPAAVRHISQALLLLPSAAQRAAAAVRIPPSLLGGSPRTVVEAVGDLAGELGGPGSLTGDERELALGLEARLRHVAVTGPGGLLHCAPRLRELGAEPSLRTAAERELVTVLLHGATMAQGLTAAEVAPQAERVLQHEPAHPDHVHTALPLLVHTLIATDSLETAGPWLETARERARRQHATVPQGLIAIERTHVLMAHGRLAEARACADEALELGVAHWATLQSMAAVVLVAIESRDTELARRLLSYRPEGTDHGYRPSSLQLLRGSFAAQRGDLPTALEYFLDWGRSAERADWRNPAVFPWRTWAAGLHYRLGHPDRAHDLIDEEYERAVAWGTPVAIGRAQRVKGAVTAGERGIELLRESAATLEGAVNALERARTALLLGRRLLHAGHTEAEAQLRRARDLALVCGAPWLAEGAGRELRTLAGSRERQPAAALTRTERRVAGLAAHGASNKEIAERLAVSSRAVEKHLTHAYRKLNVAGRSQLGSVAHLLPGPGPAAAPGF